MEPGLQLLTFSALMLLGSYVSGSLPLTVSMSELAVQRVSVVGAGLLVGTALAVIIPEGTKHPRKGNQGRGDHGHGHEGPDHDDPFEGVDRTMGVSLVLGFLFMLLVDQLAHTISKRSDSNGSAETGSSSQSRKSSAVSWTTTLGLVVHAAADGIALGAAATTKQMDVEVIVFAAIMLHKAPASFGLTTFLMHEGLERSRVKRHLLVFALAAPVMAIVTFLTLNVGDVQGGDDTIAATGVAMLFSAGTFLYVATIHVLPEVTQLSSHGGVSFTKTELVLLVVGALLPLVLTLGHHH